MERKIIGLAPQHNLENAIVVEDLLSDISIHSAVLGNKRLKDFLTLHATEWKQIREKRALEPVTTTQASETFSHSPYFLSRIFEGEDKSEVEAKVFQNVYNTLATLVEADELLAVATCSAFNLVQHPYKPHLHRRIGLVYVYFKSFEFASLEAINKKLEELDVKMRAYPEGELPTHNFEKNEL